MSATYLTRRDLKPGMVFRYADTGGLLWVVCPRHPDMPEEHLSAYGSTTTHDHDLDQPVTVVWTPPPAHPAEPEPETKEQYDARTGTTRHTKSAHSDHYQALTVEPIDAIESWGLGFRLANVVKYVARAGKKGEEPAARDLRKALSYLKREIAALEGRASWECGPEAGA